MQSTHALFLSVLNPALESAFSKNLLSLCAEIAFRVHENVTTGQLFWKTMQCSIEV